MMKYQNQNGLFVLNKIKLLNKGITKYITK